MLNSFWGMGKEEAKSTAERWKVVLMVSVGYLCNYRTIRSIFEAAVREPSLSPPSANYMGLHEWHVLPEAGGAWRPPAGGVAVASGDHLQAAVVMSVAKVGGSERQALSGHRL